MSFSSRSLPVYLVGTLRFCASVWAHEHHDDKIPEGDVISPDPLDSILWLHIFIQVFAWGIIFPTGMVLGMVRSRWHVPLQSVGVIFAIMGYFLGHKHKGRQFAPNIHAVFAKSLGWMLTVQIILGIYLKLHLENKFPIHKRLRRYAVIPHGILGKIMPVVTWVQMLFGGITMMGYCRADHFGQCLAHFIMGSGFIAYGIVLTIMLLVGQLWLRRTGRSQEFFDSSLIAAWGCVNTFTEHKWGQDWGGNDLQHTSMGIIWWAAGILGMWMSRKRDGKPRRNLIPAIVLIMTGWAMSAHPQSLMLSTMVHSVFGYTLMAAGGARLIEISFVLKDRASLSERKPEEFNSFQYLTPFLLYASGFLFMGATEEQMAWLSSLHVTHVSYILLLFSIAFLLFLYVAVLLHIYAQHVWPIETNKSIALPDTPIASTNTTPNGRARRPGPSLNARERQSVRDAEEFELTGLISDEDVIQEEDSLDSGSGRRKENRT